MDEFQTRLVTAIEDIALSLKHIEHYARMMAEPTEEELRERLQRSVSMAMFLDSSRPEDEPLN